MKFKRDYKITIEADMSDNPYWSATVKGERKAMNLEDYQTILSMLNYISGRVSNAIKWIQRQNNSD